MVAFHTGGDSAPPRFWRQPSIEGNDRQAGKMRGRSIREVCAALSLSLLWLLRLLPDCAGNVVLFCGFFYMIYSESGVHLKLSRNKTRRLSYRGFCYTYD